MARKLVAAVSCAMLLTAFSACSSNMPSNESASADGQPAMTKQEAADKYLEIIEKSNSASEEYALTIYTFDINLISEAASNLSSADKETAGDLLEFTWPEDVQDDIKALADDLNHDSAEYARVADAGSMDELNRMSLDLSDNRTSSRIRENLGLEAGQPFKTPFDVESITVGPDNYGYREVTVTVVNNLPASLRGFCIDLSIKDQNGNTLTTTTAWQHGANADTGTTVPATAQIESSVPSGSVIEVASASVEDTSTNTLYPFEFPVEQPTGIV